MNGILVSDLSLTLHKTSILKNIHADFPQGAITGIAGNNGSGKSMLLKCICGFIKPSHGEILLAGVNYHALRRFPPSIGYIIEGPGFLGDLSAWDNLRQLAKIRNFVDDQAVARSIRCVGLDPAEKKPVRKYSMGMKQRLGIAQAIMEDPDFLLFDEPMNGLDARGVSEMRTLFARLSKSGKTIVLTSHNRDDIDILCGRVYEMDAGALHVLRAESRSERP